MLNIFGDFNSNTSLVTSYMFVSTCKEWFFIPAKNKLKKC